MTVQELYDWAKDKGLLDVTIAKNYNFTVENIDEVLYLSEGNEFITIDEERIILS